MLLYRHGDGGAWACRERRGLRCHILRLRSGGIRPARVTAGGHGPLTAFQESPNRRGDRRRREPRDVQELRRILQLAGHLGSQARLDPDHRRHHVAGDAVIDGAEERAHQAEGPKAVPGVHHVVAGRVCDYTLPADPVLLGHRRQVAHNPTGVIYGDPAMQRAPQRVSPEPAVGGGVELHVAGLEELRIRPDPQVRYAILERRVFERPYNTTFVVRASKYPLRQPLSFPSCNSPTPREFRVPTPREAKCKGTVKQIKAEIELGQSAPFELTYTHDALASPPRDFHDSPLCFRLGEILTPTQTNKPRPTIRGKAGFSLRLSPLSCSWYEYFWYQMSGRPFDTRLSRRSSQFSC